MNKNASTLEIRTNRELYNMLTTGEVVRHSVKDRDKPKLSADHYKVVDVVYDSEGKYIPHCYICKSCSSVMVVHQEGGHSKLRTHPCVKHFLQKGEPDDDCYFLDKHFLTSREKGALTTTFSKIWSVDEKKIKKILPTDWEAGSWNEFLSAVEKIKSSYYGEDKDAQTPSKTKGGPSVRTAVPAAKATATKRQPKTKSDEFSIAIYGLKKKTAKSPKKKAAEKQRSPIKPTKSPRSGFNEKLRENDSSDFDKGDEEHRSLSGESGQLKKLGPSESGGHNDDSESDHSKSSGSSIGSVRQHVLENHESDHSDPSESKSYDDDEDWQSPIKQTEKHLNASKSVDGDEIDDSDRSKSSDDASVRQNKKDGVARKQKSNLQNVLTSSDVVIPEESLNSLRMSSVSPKKRINKNESEKSTKNEHKASVRLQISDQDNVGISKGNVPTKAYRKQYDQQASLENDEKRKADSDDGPSTSEPSGKRKKGSNNQSSIGVPLHQQTGKRRPTQTKEASASAAKSHKIESQKPKGKPEQKVKANKSMRTRSQKSA